MDDGARSVQLRARMHYILLYVDVCFSFTLVTLARGQLDFLLTQFSHLSEHLLWY